MQSIFKKFILFITFFSAVNVLAAPKDVLDNADSLFNAGRYVQAFDNYEQLIQESKMASPAMLLKMAFIKEGLGQGDEALYFLNLYYLSSTDEQAIAKMEELANENDLSGYSADDFDFFLVFYYRYYFEISLFLVALTFLCFAILIHNKRKYEKKPVVAGTFLIISLALLFYQVNLGHDYDRGIIDDEETYIMSGPSAGAKVVDIVASGHRVKILGHQDVWTRIRWDDEVAYVKNKNVKPLYFL